MNNLIQYGTISKLAKLFILFLLTSSYSSNKSKVLKIDPETFVNNRTTLSKIADNIEYVPLDDSIPFSGIYPGSISILQNSIFLSSRDIGIARFNRNGKLLKIIGKKGRGPGEYHYCMSIAVNDQTETIYVMDENNDIKVYFKNGLFKKSLPLPQSKDGFNFAGISFYCNNLLASQYINMGHAEYNWIILDTMGNLLQKKFNSIPTFPCRMGTNGGTFKFDNKISYWNWFNDTVFTVSPDLSYKALYLFTPGEKRLPRRELPFSTPNEFIESINKYYQPVNLFETKKYLFYHYMINKIGTIALIDKETGITFLTNQSTEADGIINDIDGGLMFVPLQYFTEGSNEYFLGYTDPFKLKKHIASESFKKSNPVYMDKKKKLESLGNRLSETGNPILILVKIRD